MTPTRADIEGRLKDYMADYDVDEGASLSFFNAIQDLKWTLAHLARFEDMARRVKEYQQASKDYDEQYENARYDKSGDAWRAFIKAEDAKAEAESALLALQTETHDGK